MTTRVIYIHSMRAAPSMIFDLYKSASAVPISNYLEATSLLVNRQQQRKAMTSHRQVCNSAAVETLYFWKSNGDPRGRFPDPDDPENYR